MALIIISFLSFFLTLGYTAMFLFLKRGWSKVKIFNAGPEPPVTRVSILIAARNEEERIHYTIEDILAQDYPADLMELIIVDDHSTDGTADIILGYADRGVRLIRLNEDKPLNAYKKKAISEAIKGSNGDLMVATDADCRMEKNWLRTIVNMYEKEGVKLISSPVLYYEERNVFEDMQALDFLFLMGFGASSIGNKMASTCNGANLAYRKDVFFELGGFSGIDDIASGDDELFLHKVASRYPDDIRFCKSTDAIVYTHAQHSMKELVTQRRRWASKATKYKNRKIVALGIFIWVTNLFFGLNILFGFRDHSYWWVAALTLTLKVASEFVFLIAVTRFAKRMELLMMVPLVSLIHVFYVIYIGIAGNTRKYIWKGRLVR